MFSRSTSFVKPLMGNNFRCICKCATVQFPVWNWYIKKRGSKTFFLTTFLRALQVKGSLNKRRKGSCTESWWYSRKPLWKLSLGGKEKRVISNGNAPESKLAITFLPLRKMWDKINFSLVRDLLSWRCLTTSGHENPMGNNGTKRKRHAEKRRPAISGTEPAADKRNLVSLLHRVVERELYRLFFLWWWPANFFFFSCHPTKKFHSDWQWFIYFLKTDLYTI